MPAWPAHLQELKNVQYPKDVQWCYKACINLANFRVFTPEEPELRALTQLSSRLITSHGFHAASAGGHFTAV